MHGSRNTIGWGFLAFREHFGQPPIQNERLAVGTKHDVIGLDIAMNHAATVRKGHGLAEVDKDLQQPLPLDFSLRTRWSMRRIVMPNGLFEGSPRTNFIT